MALCLQRFTCQPVVAAVRAVDIAVPIPLLEDLGILSAWFFRSNESVEILQSFGVRPQVLAFVVRLRRRGPFKDLEAIHREARDLRRRYRLARFEALSADRDRGEYVAWIEWKIPKAVQAVQAALSEQGGIVPLRIALESSDSARVSLLVPEGVLPRIRRLLEEFGGRDWLRAVRRVPTERWDPATTLTPRQRELLTLAFRLGYYETPAKVSLDRLGELVGISRAAFSKHLRNGERKILGTVVGSLR